MILHRKQCTDPELRQFLHRLVGKAPVIIRKIMEVREAGEYLFTHKDGSCIKGACFTEKLKRIYNYVRITKHSLYMIRKTYAIILRENGLDDAFIYLIYYTIITDIANSTALWNHMTIT